MYIYYVDGAPFGIPDIPDCPTLFHTGLIAAPDIVSSGVSYFDAQIGPPGLLTAPASDPDTAILEDRVHMVWQYHNETTDVDQIVWKKTVPAVQPDIEYTPYQQYIGDGTHPSVAAYNENVAVIYEAGADITVAYSADDGDTWNSVVVAQGVFPDIEAVGEIFYATYIVSGDLFLITSGDGGVTWSAPIQLNSVPGSVEEDENCVDIHAGGIAWVDNTGADLDVVWMKLPSEAPEIVQFDGPAQVKVNTAAEFTATADDQQDDDVYYQFDWGNGETSEWIGPSADETSITAEYTWTDQGDFEVRVHAKDAGGHIGDWSSPLPITVPRSREVINSALLEFLEHYFPVLYQFITTLLG
jgi:hypothetical protein